MLRHSATLACYSTRDLPLPETTSPIIQARWPAALMKFSTAFADSFASYYLEPGELKRRYPQWLALIEEVV